jgi:hypothetical protein
MKTRIVASVIVVLTLLLGGIVWKTIRDGRTLKEPAKRTIEDLLREEQYLAKFPAASIKVLSENNSEDTYGARIELSSEEWKKIESVISSQGMSKISMNMGETADCKELFGATEYGGAQETWYGWKYEKLDSRRAVDQYICVIRKEPEPVLVYYLIMVYPENAE